jgi:hypothetical protein
VEVAYPQFKSTDTTQNIGTLNTMIKAMIDTSFARFVSEAQGIDASADEKTDTLKVKAGEEENYKGNSPMVSRGLYISYKTHKQTPDYIEVEFGFDQYSGGAHGQKSTATFHYDIASGKNLVLADLFASNSDYLNQISRITTDYLMANKDNINTDSTFTLEGASAKEINFKNFLTTNDTLRFLFDPYAVAPYSSGPQVVAIPFSKLESIINKNSAALKTK